MYLKLCLCACALAVAATAATSIPETLSAGTYSVSLALPREQWNVQVYESEGVIRYTYNGGTPDRESFQLTVYRVALPEEAQSLEPTALAANLVVKDGLKFKNREFGQRVRLPSKPEVLACPAGTAYLYASPAPFSGAPQPHYAAAALLLPKDYKARRVAYLAVGHQVGGGTVRVEQLEYLQRLLRGLQEPAH